MADGELVVPQHISDGGLTDDGAEEVGSLKHAGGDEQAAVASTSYGELAGTGVFVLTKELGGGDEVVKNVLFLVEHTGLVPFFAVFASAAQIGDGIYAALLEPNKDRDRKRGLKRDVEAAVAVKQCGVGAIEGQTFFMGDEHRDASAVFGAAEHLFCFVAGGVEIDFGLVQDCQFVCKKIITVICGREQKRGKGKEHFGIALLA